MNDAYSDIQSIAFNDLAVEGSRITNPHDSNNQLFQREQLSQMFLGNKRFSSMFYDENYYRSNKQIFSQVFSSFNEFQPREGIFNFTLDGEQSRLEQEQSLRDAIKTKLDLQIKHKMEGSELSFGNPYNKNNNNKEWKGLRLLSSKVKYIIQENEETTYKQVAEKLVDEMKQANQLLSPKKQCKEESNVKRRVYDALNVLIAAKLIVKKGKKLIANKNIKLFGKCHQKERWDVYSKILTELELKNRVSIKKKFGMELDLRQKALASLISRNSEAEFPSSQQSVGAFIKKGDEQQPFPASQQSFNVCESYEPEERIIYPFPMIAIPIKLDQEVQQYIIQSEMQILMLNKQNNLRIYSKNQLTIMSDLEILIRIVKLKQDDKESKIEEN